MVDGEYKLLTPAKVEFEITKDKPTKEVEFRVDEIGRNATEISFDKQVPAGTKVYAVAQDGTKNITSSKFIWKKMPSRKT